MYKNQKFIFNTIHYINIPNLSLPLISIKIRDLIFCWYIFFLYRFFYLTIWGMTFI
jgi:hypothetical protein